MVGARNSGCVVRRLARRVRFRWNCPNLGLVFDPGLVAAYRRRLSDRHHRTNQMAADFKKTLDKFEVPEKEQTELFAIVESTKPDIVISEE